MKNYITIAFALLLGSAYGQAPTDASQNVWTLEECITVSEKYKSKFLSFVQHNSLHF